MKDKSFYFDEAAFWADFEKTMRKALHNAGEKAKRFMTENLRSIPKTGGTGKPEWHKEMETLLQNRYVGIVDGIMEQLVGLVDVTEKFTLIRAKLLEYGAGSRADPEGGGSLSPIAHVKGKPGLNDWLTGYSEPSDRETYLLPDGFNQAGAHWFRDAIIKVEEIFDEEVERAWEKIDPFKYLKMK